MAEYIDRADLVERLENRVKDYGRDCNSNAPIISRTYQAVLHMVENLPTADVVPVVRCGQCKKVEWIDNEITKYRQYFCPLHNHELVGASHYCSYGERKDE